MKLTYLNDIDDSVKREIKRTSMLSNFKTLDRTVAFFQSVKHDMAWPAVTVPREDSKVLSTMNKPLQELLAHFSDEHDLIIWIGKSASKFNDLKKVFPHEFRHVEQQVLGQDSFIKDRALDCLLSTVAPIEKDASYFADKIVGLRYDASYDWKQKADNLFALQKHNIKKLYDALKSGQDEVVIINPREAVCTAMMTKEQKNAALHFFEKAIPLI